MLQYSVPLIRHYAAFDAAMPIYAAIEMMLPD